MTTPADTDWIREGGRAAVYTSDTGKFVSVRLVTIKRLTATQILLEDQTKWRRNTLRRVGDSDQSGWSTRKTELIAPDDQRVRDGHAIVYASNLRHTIAGYAKPTDIETALTLLDHIEQAAADTRRRIEALAAKSTKEK